MRNRRSHPLTHAGRNLLRRREFLSQTASSLPAIALAKLLAQQGLLAASPENRVRYDAVRPYAPRLPRRSAAAKNVLVVFCAGACSQLETWDYKPELIKQDGKPLAGGPAVTFQGPAGNLARPQYAFRPYGECGKMASDLVPHLAALVDDFAFLHTLTSKTNTHGPGENFLSTGFVQDGFPSIGSWISYALGTENQNLPAFVAIPDPRGVPQASVNNWGPGFLPATFQGTPLSSTRPLQNLSPPSTVSSTSDAAARSLLALMNAEHAQLHPGDSDLEARIASYELAARMQLSVPKIADLAAEPAHVLTMYGADDPTNPVKEAFARNCILARRLIEAGVRFVQLFNGAYASAGALNWDGHAALKSQYDIHGPIMDQPVAALISDLKQRGLLQETLVVWCTEFGRMPMFQQGALGRDHNPDGFTAFLTGAGVKRGVSYGRTDELGLKAVENVLSIHDLNATILHLLGIDHERLTYLHNGIERRLTDVHGRIVREILA